ncbi:hypothetical protein O181_100884 [Austropuccinia psidii MF-1]|uniref:Uncharacterized protein n=1 Tax=Austropuccinia psidii MF-1 TaxID=1389203 RepID=A0A9Q3PGT9_9BASI|nr:hypothetical protein [Austropuccinia psidii MF-1]
MHKNTYIGVYNPQCTAFLGLVNETCVEYSNKSHAFGFGVVIDRKDKAHQIGNNNETILSCTVCHNEWNPQERLQVNFDVTYIVRKKGSSSNFFRIFQTGREIGVSGPLIDWDEDNESWVVLVGRKEFCSRLLFLIPTNDVGHWCEPLIGTTVYDNIHY